MKLKLLVLAVLVMVTPALADVVVYSDFATAQQSNPIPAGTTFAVGGAGGGGIDGGAIDFATVWGGMVTIDVFDCCIVGDVYEVMVDGVSVGITSPAELYGSTLSSGSFSLYLDAGAHTVDIWDITLSYLGFASPFGGGIVGGEFTPAGLSVTVTSHVPEPGSLLLLGTGLLGLAGRIRKHLKA